MVELNEQGYNVTHSTQYSQYCGANPDSSSTRLIACVTPAMYHCRLNRNDPGLPYNLSLYWKDMSLRRCSRSMCWKIRGKILRLWRSRILLRRKISCSSRLYCSHLVNANSQILSGGIGASPFKSQTLMSFP